VFASGIWTLAILAGALIVAGGGNTLRLIPLYAIGVFTGFTWSQTGMVQHWRRTRLPRWKHRAVINGAGAVTTALATVIFLVTKFTDGAWVVVLAVPAFITLFVRIHRYYQHARQILGLGSIPDKPRPSPSSSSCRWSGCLGSRSA
jgi:O-antigen/teichoic acid export membrane protein